MIQIEDGYPKAPFLSRAANKVLNFAFPFAVAGLSFSAVSVFVTCPVLHEAM